MLVNLYDCDYDTTFINEVVDINDRFKYIGAYQINAEAHIIFSESYNILLLAEASDGFWSKIKEKIKLLINTIKELWDKFTSKIQQSLMGDIEWVKTYSKALLKTEIPDETYTMFAYPANKAFMNKLFASNILPAYNPNDKRLFDALESADTFRETYLKQFIVKGMDFNDGVKYSARGSVEDPIDYSNTQIKPFIPDMVDFCVGYDKFVDTLKKEKSTLERSINQILRDIDKIKVVQQNNPNVNDIKSKSKEVNDSNRPAIEGKPKDAAPKSGPAPKQESTVVKDFYLMSEECTMSQVCITEKLSIFNEAPGLKVTPKDTNTTVAKDNTTGKIANVPKTVDSSDNKDDISKRYQVYITEVYNFIGLRMTIVEEEFKTYIQVLRFIAKAKGFGKADKGTAIKTKAEKEEELANKEKKEKEEDASKPKRTLKGDVRKVADKGKSIMDRATRKMNSFASYFKG